MPTEPRRGATCDLPTHREMVGPVAHDHSLPLRARGRRSSACRSRLLPSWECALALVVLGAAACDGSAALGGSAGLDTLSLPAILTVDSALLSGAALAAWGPDGRFTRAADRLDPVYPTLLPAEAGAAASEYLRTVGPAITDLLEGDYGGPLTLSALAPCEPPRYAESSLAPPPDSLALEYRIAIGPSWLQYYCEAGVPKVLLTVGAYATPLTTSPWDSIRVVPLPTLLSASVLFGGLRKDVRALVNAEEAATRVAQLTGRRVIRVPRLVRPRPPGTSVGALWQVDLDGTATVRGRTTGVVRGRATLWYGVAGARSRLAVWDSVDPDPGPYVDNTLFVLSDGTRRALPFSIPRSGTGSFLYHLEPVVRP